MKSAASSEAYESSAGDDGGDPDMASTVGTRPNHYDVLGIAPTASDREIAEAFAREVAAPRPFGGLAQVGIAHAVLRDPAKRRAYDESLGLRREPQRRTPPPAVSFRGSAHFMGATEPAARSKPEAKAQPRPEAPAEQRTGSFIAAALREPARAEPPAEAPRAAPPAQPQPERQHLPPSRPNPDLEQLVRQLQAVQPARDSDESEERRFGLNRTAATAGALLVGAVAIGAWAGLSAGGSPEPKAARTATSVALPPARQLAAAAPVAATGYVPQQIAPVSPTIEHRARAARPRQPGGSEERLADISRSLGAGDGASTAAPAATEQAAAEAQPAVAVPASLPLPSKVIARTIERIGYACGDIASSAAGDGPGVYTVTCTSGQTYRAAPVGGRYHFKRLGSH